jgi:hypothetical protein
MDGRVARHDDPVWSTWRPPAGYQCRCRVISLSEAQAQRFIDADRQRMEKEPDLAQARATAQPDPGWDYDPSADPTEGLRRAWERVVGSAHPALAEAARQSIMDVPAEPQKWIMLEGDQATLGEIERLGDERLQELLAFRVPDDDSVAVAGFRGRVLSELIDNTFYGGDAALPFAKNHLFKYLRTVRNVGGERLATTNKTGKARKLTDRVGDKLPTSWINQVNAAGTPYKVTVSEKGRGWHNAAHWDSRTGEIQRRIQTDSGSTLEHEWTHAVQAAIPELDALFQEAHRKRTAGEPLQWLGGSYARDEQTRRDKYVTPYQGKEYGARGALEVMTMAMQAVLGEDQRSNDLLERMIRDDKDMLRLALGVLFHYRPKKR